MKLSLIVPVYNVGEFLEECLRSVIDEADGGVEVICVDDGSTDSSVDMLDRFARLPTAGFDAVRDELRALSRRSAERLSGIDWVAG